MPQGSMSLAPRILLAAGETSTWYAVLQTFLLLAQMVFGIWGTRHFASRHIESRRIDTKHRPLAQRSVR